MKRIIIYTTFLFCSLIATAQAPTEITFDRLGAIYHINDEGYAMVRAEAAANQKIDELNIEIVDIDGRCLKRTSEKVPNKFGRYYYVPLPINSLGYFYVRVIKTQKEVAVDTAQAGYGVIPDVTLQKKDPESPFGVGAHYARYADWRLGEIQQQLGMAWLRDKAGWKELDGQNVPHDPFIDYLNKYNICWLPILDYVDAWHGAQDEKGFWHFDDDAAAIGRYVKKNKGLLYVYESQNEPNNFAGWKYRFPHPEGQNWRPQGWGTAFTDLAIQITDTIRNIDPKVRVMWPGEEEWTEFLLEARQQTASHIDFTAIHPYVLWIMYPELTKFANNYYPQQKAMLKSHGVSDEIWITETGWSTYTPDSTKRHFPYVTELQQAQLLVRNYLIHLYRGAKKVFWYEFVEEPFGIYDPETSFGLLRYDNMLTVKPAAVAYANMVNNFRNLTPLGELKANDEKTYGFIYSKEGKNQPYALAIWHLDSNSKQPLNLQYTKQLTSTDIFGRKTIYNVTNGHIDIPISANVQCITGFDYRDLKKLMK